MSVLFKKLNLGTRDIIHVLNAPESFEPELGRLAPVTVRRKLSGGTDFALAFVITQAALDEVSRKLVAAAKDDAVLWLAYPKGSSRKYRCEFNRDSGWQVLGAAGYEPVRMVAIDEDWTALRFRKVEHIGTMTRSKLRPISAAGRKKVAQSRSVG